MLLHGASAQARPADVHFVWQRTPASLCPTRTVLQDDVEAVLGRPVFGAATGARVIVHGVGDDAPGGVTVRLHAMGAGGELLGSRELTAPAGQCASLRDAIVLVLTLFVEFEQGHDRDEETVLGFGAGASIAQAPMPRLALALGPVLRLAIGDVWHLHARGAYWPAVSIRTARGVGAVLEAVSLQLGICARVWAGLGLCASGEGGILFAAPLELQGPPRQTRLLAHGVLDARWDLALSGTVHTELGAGAQLSLSRPAFSYLRSDGQRMAVYRPQALGVILHAAVIILDE